MRLTRHLRRRHLNPDLALRRQRQVEADLLALAADHRHHRLALVGRRCARDLLGGPAPGDLGAGDAHQLVARLQPGRLGRRLDHVWLTPALAPKLRAIYVWRGARDWPNPSDHVPVIADLAI